MMLPVRPSVLLISLNTHGLFQRTNPELMSALDSNTNLIQIEDAVTASTNINNGDIKAVILVDGALARSDFRDKWLLARLVQFVSDGGTLICAGIFGSNAGSSDGTSGSSDGTSDWLHRNAGLSDLTNFFVDKFLLPWTSSRSLRRAGFHLNVNVGHGLAGKGLPLKYEQTAITLKSVATSDKVYVHIPVPGFKESKLSLEEAAPGTDREVEETAVAFAKIRAGKLGYIGGSVEKENAKVLMAMLGLDDWTKTVDEIIDYSGGQS